MRATSRQACMEKSIYTTEYAVMLGLLRQMRKDSGLTQVELARKLRRSQSFVTKAEVGQRRLDVIQLRAICHVLGTTLPEFISKLEERLTDKKRAK
jgi:transcriptional regulator with XRE-family HTH domain